SKYRVFGEGWALSALWLHDAATYLRHFDHGRQRLWANRIWRRTSRQERRNPMDGRCRQSALTNRLDVTGVDCRPRRYRTAASFREERRRAAAHALTAYNKSLLPIYRSATT